MSHPDSAKPFRALHNGSAVRDATRRNSTIVRAHACMHACACCAAKPRCDAELSRIGVAKRTGRR